MGHAGPKCDEIEEPATAGELARFAELQAAFARCFPAIERDHLAPRTVLVVPSMTLDAEFLKQLEMAAPAFHPPATSTRPSGGSVALCSPRASSMLPVGVHVPVVGL